MPDVRERVETAVASLESFARQYCLDHDLSCRFDHSALEIVVTAARAGAGCAVPVTDDEVDAFARAFYREDKDGGLRGWDDFHPATKGRIRDNIRAALNGLRGCEPDGERTIFQREAPDA